MNKTPKAAPSPRRRSAAAVDLAGHHSCVLCPACGTEACRTLQDLGMYCDTAVAAYEATRAMPGRTRKLAVV